MNKGFLACLVLLGCMLPALGFAQISSYDCSQQPTLLQDECEVLVDLYEATDGDNRTTNTDWLESDDLCDWYGVSCNSNGTKVKKMILKNNNLVGELPSSLGDLQDVKILNFKKNDLCGLIPESLKDLSSLRRLNLQKNNLLTEGYSSEMQEFLDSSVVRWNGQDSQECFNNTVEITFVELDINPDQVRADVDNFVIAAFDVNINSMQDVSLEKISFDVLSDDTFLTDDLFNHFDEVELIVTTDGIRRTYDLDESFVTNNTFTVGDDDLGIIFASDEEITITLEADTVSTYPNENIGNTFRVTLDVTNDVVIVGEDDDEIVSNITPSSIIFDTIELVSSTVQINSINLTDVSVVRGAENVDVVRFEVEADDVSSLVVEGFRFYGSYIASGGTVMPITQDVVTAIKLWVLTDGGYELIDADGGFSLSDGLITLDDFDEVEVSLEDSVEFLLTVDVIDSDDVVGGMFSFVLSSSDIEDDDNNQLCDLSGTLDCGGADSTRNVFVNDSGQLSIEVDTTDSQTDEDVFVVAGHTLSEVPAVASFEFTVANEPVEVEDIELILTGYTDDAGEFSSSNEVFLLDENGNVLATELRSNITSIDFNNIDLLFSEGVTNIYVKVVSDVIGDNQNGFLTQDLQMRLVVDEVTGEDSGDDADVIYDGDTMTLPSRSFAIVPVQFIDADFVQSAGGVNVSTSTPNGNDITIAILELIADEWDNTDSNDGSDLDAVVNTITIETSNPTEVTNYEVRRIGNGSTSYYAGVQDGNMVTFTFSTGGVSDANTQEVGDGEDAYFVIRADIDAVGNSMVGVELEMDGGVLYSTTDSSYASNELRIGEGSIESQHVIIDNN